jgi:ABC-type transporter Mla subunit MlaD
MVFVGSVILTKGGIMYKVLVIFLILGCAAENGGQFTNSYTVTATQTNAGTLSALV